MLEHQINKPNVLIVDDDPRMREALVMILKQTDKYTIVTAEDGEQALEVLRKHKTRFGLGKNDIACVVLDLKMPVLDGLSFLKQWRLEETLHLVPIVLLSAYEDQEKWDKAADPIEGVIAAYLKKPVKPEALVSTLKAIIEKHEMEFMVQKLQKAAYQGAGLTDSAKE